MPSILGKRNYMEKDEILKLNKQDSQRYDEKQKGDIVDACNKAYRYGRLLCAFIIGLDWFVGNSINYSVLSIFMFMTGIYLLFMYKDFKKKYELILGIIYGLCAILLFIKYIVSMF